MTTVSLQLQPGFTSVCPQWVATQEGTKGQGSGGRKGTIPAEERGGVEKVLLAEDGTF